MLILQRDIGQAIVVGDETTVVVSLTVDERRALGGCSDPALMALARRLAEAEPGPIRVILADVRSRDRVRLGITAPKGVPVHRDEVYQEIKRDGCRRFVRVGVERADAAASETGS